MRNFPMQEEFIINMSGCWKDCVKHTYMLAIIIIVDSTSFNWVDFLSGDDTCVVPTKVPYVFIHSTWFRYFGEGP